MSKKKLFWGIGLILAAVYLVLSELKVFALIPFGDVLYVLVALYFIIGGIVERGFFRIFIPVGCLLGHFKHMIPYQPIQDLRWFTIMLASFMLAIGFNLLFKKKKKEYTAYNFGGKDGNPSVENIADGAAVRVHNTFGAVSKYINSTDFRKGDFDNSFGSCNIYFNNAILVSGRADVDVSNSFGEMNLYFPKTWRIEMKQDANFGNVKTHGMGSTLPDAPTVYLNADSNFGEINIYFE